MGRPTLGEDAALVARKLELLGYSPEVTNAVAAGPYWSALESLAARRPGLAKVLADDLTSGVKWPPAVAVFGGVVEVAAELRSVAQREATP